MRFPPHRLEAPCDASFADGGARCSTSLASDSCVTIRGLFQPDFCRTCRHARLRYLRVAAAHPHMATSSWTPLLLIDSWA
eukprot:scaffold117895_cov29-Tisochrysis_lutea.AAC.1